jgi:hypothetical protein
MAARYSASAEETDDLDRGASFSGSTFKISKDSTLTDRRQRICRAGLRGRRGLVADFANVAFSHLPRVRGESAAAVKSHVADEIEASGSLPTCWQLSRTLPGCELRGLPASAAWHSGTHPDVRLRIILRVTERFGDQLALPSRY